MGEISTDLAEGHNRADDLAIHNYISSGEMRRDDFREFLEEKGIETTK